MVTHFRHTMRRGAAARALAVLGLAGILFVPSGDAAAQFASPTAEAQPPVVNVPATRSAQVPVDWEITNTLPDNLTSIQATTANLFFNGPNGQGSLTLQAPIVRTVDVATGQSVRIRETMVIPQSFLLRVLQAGTRTINVERFFQAQFAPGQFVPIEGQLTVNITGSLGAEFQISRIDLRFQNEAVQIIVPQYHPPEVRLDIAYTGTGLLQGTWEVADPRVTATGGNPIFRVLRQDRIRLGIGGFSRVKGPKLPADMTGLHIVRFRILDGPLRGEAPVVRYFVKAASPDGEDWWKRYIRPHKEGDGLVRVPAEPEDEEVTVEESAGPDEVEGEPQEEGAPAPEDDGAPGDEGTPEDGGAPGDEGTPAEEAVSEEEAAPEDGGAPGDEGTPEEEAAPDDGGDSGP